MDLFNDDNPDFNDDYDDEDLEDINHDPLNDPEGGQAPTHPRLTNHMSGHKAIESQLLDYFNKDRMPHALIFSGPVGIGKATMAYRLARFLLKHGATDQSQDSLFGAPEPVIHTNMDVATNDPVFSKIAASGHSDLLSIERPFDETKGKFKDNVLVDDVRKIAPFLHMTAAEGGWRVVIVDDADTMTRNSQNALLKILEEPPSKVVLILVAHRAGALLPTIRSRSRVMNFDALPEECMKELLTRFGHRPASDDFAMLMGLTRGSIGRALDILAADGLSMITHILDLLAKPAPDWVAIHKFSDSIGNLENGFDLYRQLMPSIYTTLARAKARNIPPQGFGAYHEWATATLAATPLESLLDTAHKLEQGLDRIQFANLDKRQGILSAFAQVFQ